MQEASGAQAAHRTQHASTPPHLLEQVRPCCLIEVAQEDKLQACTYAPGGATLIAPRRAQPCVRNLPKQVETRVRIYAASPVHGLQIDTVLRPVLLSRLVTEPPPVIQGAAARNLLEIRSQLGLTNREFARALNIGQSTLASYLYGRVAQVPQGLLSRAVALAQDHAARGSNQRDRYLAQASMEDIVDDWLRRVSEVYLKHASADRQRRHATLRLLKLLGVHKSTFWRWLQPADTEKAMRPSLERLRLYDDMVQKATDESRRNT